ncbi:hypothetical protein [Nocardioides sp. T2.26MG-1]|uniref:hypothetical protein n=1 Tax=Nocardioides sp. T2.26MG-1 TaxID=3041166 RepID=UPI0024774919|nr:hypothetical protein [Nocardioides sp. T2.26MG-1]CAI9418854.1 hypothetical protein HIDPHFAB_03417 [Nocardioides sp. T2.26MG-1]
MPDTHIPTTSSRAATADPAADPGAQRAYLLLHTVFTVAPIAFGLDKFAGLLTDWDDYLAPWINDLVPGSGHDAMLLVGVIEVVAGVLVALAPRIGGYVVALWLAGIIVDLVSMGDYYDIALRDFGLLVGALALAQLATTPGRRGWTLR